MSGLGTALPERVLARIFGYVVGFTPVLARVCRRWRAVVRALPWSPPLSVYGLCERGYRGLFVWVLLDRLGLARLPQNSAVVMRQVVDVDVAMCRAAKSGNRELVELLKHWGGTNYNAGLAAAAEGGHLPMVEAFLRWGGRTVDLAAVVAAEAGHEPIVDHLLNRVKEPAVSDTALNLALFAAARGDHPSIARLLAHRGACEFTRALGVAASRGSLLTMTEIYSWRANRTAWRFGSAAARLSAWSAGELEGVAAVATQSGQQEALALLRSWAGAGCFGAQSSRLAPASGAVGSAPHPPSSDRRGGSLKGSQPVAPRFALWAQGPDRVATRRRPAPLPAPLPVSVPTVLPSPLPEPRLSTRAAAPAPAPAPALVPTPVPVRTLAPLSVLMPAPVSVARSPPLPASVSLSASSATPIFPHALVLGSSRSAEGGQAVAPAAKPEVVPVARVEQHLGDGFRGLMDSPHAGSAQLDDLFVAIATAGDTQYLLRGYAMGPSPDGLDRAVLAAARAGFDDAVFLCGKWGASREALTDAGAVAAAEGYYHSVVNCHRWGAFVGPMLLAAAEAGHAEIVERCLRWEASHEDARAALGLSLSRGHEDAAERCRARLEKRADLSGLC